MVRLKAGGSLKQFASPCGPTSLAQRRVRRVPSSSPQIPASSLLPGSYSEPDILLSQSRQTSTSSAAAPGCAGESNSGSRRRPARGTSSTCLPFVPHEEINTGNAELSCIVVRSGQKTVLVEMDLPDFEPNPKAVDWGDDLPRKPGG